MQEALKSGLLSLQQLERRVIKDPRSPTGFAVLHASGRYAFPLYLDTYRGPGYKLDADGRVFYDSGG